MTRWEAVTILTVGLTGDVGAGKSTLSRVWREMGARVIDADEVAKAQWYDPEVQRQVKGRWGDDFFNGDKKEVYGRIAAKIFGDDAEYQFATKLIHAATFKEIKRAAAENDGWLVIEIPLLFESGHYEWLDYVVYATAPREKRIERNRSRGWDDKEMARREQWFMPREEKMARADFVLENNGTLEEWRNLARQLAKQVFSCA